MKKLYRSNTDKIVSGFFGGLSEMTKIDSTIFRLVFIILLLVTGIFPFLIAYLVAWVLVPIKEVKKSSK